MFVDLVCRWEQNGRVPIDHVLNHPIWKPLFRIFITDYSDESVQPCIFTKWSSLACPHEVRKQIQVFDKKVDISSLTVSQACTFKITIEFYHFLRGWLIYTVYGFVMFLHELLIMLISIKPAFFHQTFYTLFAY